MIRSLVGVEHHLSMCWHARGGFQHEELAHMIGVVCFVALYLLSSCLRRYVNLDRQLVPTVAWRCIKDFWHSDAGAAASTPPSIAAALDQLPR